MDHWEKVRLEDVAIKVGSGSTPRGGSKAYKKSGIPLIRSMNVHFDGLHEEGLAFIDDEQAEKLRNVEVRSADVLLNITGASIGRVTQANDAMDGARVNQHVCIIRPKEQLNPTFLSRYLASPTIQRMIWSEEYGVTRQALTKQGILDFEIPLPPLKEQHRIVTKIEALTTRSRKARQALDTIPALLDQFRQSVLAAAFRGDLTADWRSQNPDVEPAEKLLERIRVERRARWEAAELEKMKAKGKVPKNDKWKGKYAKLSEKATRSEVAEMKAEKYRLTDLPDSWVLSRFRDVITLQPGYAFKSRNFVDSGIQLLRGTNVVPGGTRWDDKVHLSAESAEFFQEYLLCKDDIVIAMDRPVISTGLKVARIKSSDLPALLLQRVGRFHVDISEDYVLHFLNSPLFLSHIQDQATGTQLPHISKNDIESVLLPIPPLEEQEAIVEHLNDLCKYLSGIQTYSEESHPQLDQLDQSILAKAFRGQLVPQDPTDEPASVLLERIHSEREKMQKTGKGKKKGRKGKGKGKAATHS